MTRMTPSEAFVETLAAHGVTDIFGIMGSAFMDAMDIFEPAGIRFIPVCHDELHYWEVIPSTRDVQRCRPITHTNTCRGMYM